jgi:hypothetical protein
MSGRERTFSELRAAFIRGDLSQAEFEAELEASADVDDRDALWAKYARDGLYSDAITQDGYLSFAGGDPERVDTDG